MLNWRRVSRRTWTKLEDAVTGAEPHPRLNWRAPLRGLSALPFFTAATAREALISSQGKKEKGKELRKGETRSVGNTRQTSPSSAHDGLREILKWTLAPRCGTSRQRPLDVTQELYEESLRSFVALWLSMGNRLSLEPVSRLTRL